MLVRNTGRYSFTFRYTDEKGKEKKIEFDRRRYFRDTGNIASTGITELSEEIHNQLMKDPRYKKLMDTEVFAVVTEEDLVIDNDSKALLEAKDKEIEELKKKLEEKPDPDEETKKALEEKDNEINSLKAKLEAIGKDDDTKATEGF